MALWIFYFLAKLLFFARAYILFHPFPNLLLALYVFVLPWALKDRFPIRTVWTGHLILGCVLGFAVFWGDSYYPPFFSVVNFVGTDETRPTLEFIGSFLLGYWNTAVVATLAAIGAVSVTLARVRAPLWGVVIIIILGLGAQDLSRKPISIDQAVKRFYVEQSQPEKTIVFPHPADSDVPFDIVLLHVCSMSWDDLRKVGLDHDPFLSRFDVTLTGFNSVTSYSTPAGLRLLRSKCGQTVEGKLFWDASNEECNLMPSLRQAGYETSAMINNEGSLATSMMGYLSKWTKADLPKDHPPFTLEAYNFDASKLYSNFEELEYWWKERNASKAKRAALYYNTVSLHGGTRVVGEKGWRKRPEIYKHMLHQVFGDFSRFFDLIENSNRNVLVVLVAEHGAALFGSRIQAADLRDIPLPPLTNVPVAFRFFRSGHSEKPRNQRIGTQTSYQAIASAIRLTLSHPDRSFALSNPEVPETPYLSENQYSRVFVHEGGIYFQGKDSQWTRLPEEFLLKTETP